MGDTKCLHIRHGALRDFLGPPMVVQVHSAAATALPPLSWGAIKLGQLGSFHLLDYRWPRRRRGLRAGAGPVVRAGRAAAWSAREGTGGGRGVEGEERGKGD